MNRIMVIRATLAVVALVLETGCATMMDRNIKGYSVVTTPPGAQVMVNGMEFGATPALLTVDKQMGLMVRITKPNCPTFDTVVTSQMSPYVWGNLLFGGVFGLLIDLSTKSAYELHPDNLQVMYGERDGKCIITGSNLVAAVPVDLVPRGKSSRTTEYLDPRGR